MKPNSHFVLILQKILNRNISVDYNLNVSKREKLLLKWLNKSNKQPESIETVIAVCEYYFGQNNIKYSSSHVNIRCNELNEILTFVVHNNKVKAPYLRKIAKAIKLL